MHRRGTTALSAAFDLVCAYVRDGEAYIPNGQSVLMAGDRIILFIQTEYSKKVMKYFKGRE